VPQDALLQDALPQRLQQLRSHDELLCPRPDLLCSRSDLLRPGRDLLRRCSFVRCSRSGRDGSPGSSG